MTIVCRIRKYGWTTFVPDVPTKWHTRTTRHSSTCYPRCAMSDETRTCGTCAHTQCSFAWELRQLIRSHGHLATSGEHTTLGVSQAVANACTRYEARAQE